jgi:4-hydroxythreonine-4-phosphate dehydrogenase
MSAQPPTTHGPTRTNGNGKPLIGITMGDPLGVGPEVIIKALADENLRNQARFIIFGWHENLELVADQAELPALWWREQFAEDLQIASGVLLADFDHLSAPAPSVRHEPDELAGAASFAFVEAGIRYLQRGAIDALVTAPICKASWALAKESFAGHTDLLAQRFNAKRVTMAFVARDLRVALASTHVPLFDLRHHFTIGLVHTPIVNLDHALREWFGIECPRIGVLGLNPHAGEEGLLGDEERRVIEPALAMARNNGIHVEGPLPADTAFIPERMRRFDGIVAMYHDQGLIPVKMHAFHDAVNVTLGLTNAKGAAAIRTSPDHGTAFDIAGRNVADPGSMRAALELAIELATHQKQQHRQHQIASAGTPRR